MFLCFCALSSSFAIFSTLSRHDDETKAIYLDFLKVQRPSFVNLLVRTEEKCNFEAFAIPRSLDGHMARHQLSNYLLNSCIAWLALA
jgi:hypothetical protein